MSDPIKTFSEVALSVPFITFNIFKKSRLLRFHTVWICTAIFYSKVYLFFLLLGLASSFVSQSK